MISPAQNKKYWRRWGACARANHWTMCGGRLNATAVLDTSEHHCAVHAAALQLAAQHVVALAAEHLRHGCHVVALGRDKPHTQFTNRDFDALLNYWGDERDITGLLIEPADLAASIHHDAPNLKQRERLLIGMRRNFLEGYAAEICARIHGTRDWEQLPDDALEDLNHLLHTRPNARKPAPAPAREEQTADCPF